MKKTVALILLLCTALSLSACIEIVDRSTAPSETVTPENTTAENTEPEAPTPEITLQEVYDAGKSLTALLGSHESVYVQVTVNGKVLREEYLDKQSCYAFYSSEYMDIGFDYASFTTDHSQYDCFENIHSYIVTLTPNGRMDPKEIFAEAGNGSFVSSVMLDDNAVITEQDGFIIVACTANLDEIMVDEDVVSCVETYTIDAKTREMTAIKTVYTFKDGSVEEGVVTVTRDVEAPEGMKSFLAYEQENTDLRTVTIVSNPGTENEKTETVQAPKGMPVVISPDWDVEQLLEIYSDAACTQPISESLDNNADVTVYIKWVG